MQSSKIIRDRKTLRKHLVWNNPLRIKGDVGRSDEITTFGYIIMILCGNDFKSYLNSMIRYLFSRSEIQHHLETVILD